MIVVRSTKAIESTGMNIWRPPWSTIKNCLIHKHGAKIHQHEKHEARIRCTEQRRSITMQQIMETMHAFRKRWRHQEWIKNASRLTWLRRKQETKNCTKLTRNCEGICSNRQGNVWWMNKRCLHHPGLSQCHFRS